MTTPGGLSDLLSQVAQGNESAFAELYQLSSAKLYGVALRMLRSRELADDVLQEAFVKIWTRAGAYDPAIAAPMTWMSAIVRNRALDELRRRAARPATSDETELEDVPSNDEHALVGLERADAAARLQRCIEGLELEKQQMVRLAYLDGYSRDELARRFGRPEGTIKTWLRRSLAQLKGCLEA